MDTFPDWWADLQDLPAELGFFGVFLVLCACGFGLPMSKDALLFAAGTAAGLMGGGRAALEAFLWCLAGVVTGDAVMYLEGRLCGPWLRKSRLIRRILPPRRFARIRHAFRRRGVAVLLTARFTPGIRGPVYICCGLIRALGFPSFMLINTLSSAVYTALWITAGCLLADQLGNAAASTASLQRWILAAVAVIMLSFLLAVQIIRRRRMGDGGIQDPMTAAGDPGSETGTSAEGPGDKTGEPGAGRSPPGKGKSRPAKSLAKRIRTQVQSPPNTLPCSGGYRTEKARQAPPGYALPSPESTATMAVSKPCRRRKQNTIRLALPATDTGENK